MSMPTRRSMRAARLIPTPFLLLAASIVFTAATLPAWADEGTATDDASAAVAPAADIGDEAPNEVYFYSAVTVTATGSTSEAFRISTPVTVIAAEEIENRAPDNAADLLRDEPGADVNGVGPNQMRPVIRGLRGLRILFLENGLRLNNARRQSDFGEIAGLIDVDSVETMEILRGPASVLYGTDAIGGVLNLITRTPSFDDARFGGALGLRWSDADDQQKAHARLSSASERWGWTLGYTYRDAEAYSAPAGTFGDITLAERTEVVDTGLRDDNVYGYLGWQPKEGHSLFARVNRYRADETGFGFVEPSVIGDTSGARIRILYPFQDFDKVTLGWTAVDLDQAWASTVDLALSYQRNERELVNDIAIDIGPLFPGAPNSDVKAETLNRTDLETIGSRLEITRPIGDQLITYGFDYYRDDSFNTDSSVITTTLRFFPGPGGSFVDVSRDDIANAPNAENVNLGLFVQDEIHATDRLSATIGARWAQTRTRAEPTPGWQTADLDFDDDAIVGAVNLTYRLNDQVNLVGSVGRAFRAPNIIERLFNGPTPEGIGYQVLNPGLGAETSTNVDLGFKFRTRRSFLEAILFRNDVEDAIVQHTLSAAEIATLPPAVRDAIAQSGIAFVVQQRNADELVIEGLELAGAFRFHNGVSVGGNYTHLRGESEIGGPAADPTGETFSDKVVGWVRYEPPGGRYWLEYRVRHNGEEDVALDPAAEPGPLGTVLPSFTVHSMAAGLTFGDAGARRHTVGLIVDNLTDELYAEFTNATFFRPQSERNVIVTYGWRF